MKQAEYYSYAVRYGGRRRYLLWYSNESDRVLLNGDGHLAVFASHEAAAHHLRDVFGFVAHESTNSLNLDAVAEWCRKPTSKTLDCNLLLDAWNLFGDIANSVGDSRSQQAGAGSEFDAVYDKLFYGCNLPAVNRGGAVFTPAWSKDEIARIVTVLSAGLAEFDSLL